MNWTLSSLFGFCFFLVLCQLGATEMFVWCFLRVFSCESFNKNLQNTETLSISQPTFGIKRLEGSLYCVDLSFSELNSKSRV